MHGNNGRMAMTIQALIGVLLSEGEAVRPFQNRWLAAVSRLRAQAGAMTLLGLLSVPLLVVHASSQKAIDTQRSALTVRVYKAGMFSPFGHEHTIRAPIQDGTFDEDRRSVEFVVDSRTLRVVDSGVSDKDRADIQNTMLSPKVLDSSQFGEIRFHSTQVSGSGENRWTVHGDLTLHGQTHPVKVDVERQDGRYRGFGRLRQSEFGITPVAVAGGTIKVKDEVRVEFEVMGK
jgi:polyisoprenoid-binding protein YceI